MTDTEKIVLNAIKTLDGYNVFVAYQEVEAETKLPTEELDEVLISLDKQNYLQLVQYLSGKVPMIFQLR